MNRFIFSVFVLSLLSGCGNDDPVVFLDQSESFEIREMCLADRYLTIGDIAGNLEGEWQLISYGCGFCVPHDHPEALVTFDGSSGVLLFEEDPDIGIPGKQTIPFTWTLEINSGIFGDMFLTLVTDPPHYAINGINIFCEDFMYYDITPVDGQMFLYEKQ